MSATETELVAVAPGHVDHTSHTRKPLPWRGNARTTTIVGLLASDLFAWLACTAALKLIAAAVGITFIVVWISWFIPVFWVSVRAVMRRYPAVGMAPSEEVRRSFLAATAAVAAKLIALLAIGETTSIVLFSLTPWLVVPFVEWYCRAFTRAALRRRNLFGVPVLILGTGSNARRAIRELKAQPDMGLVPVACFGDEAGAMAEGHIEGVPVLGSLDDAITYRFDYGITHGMLALTRREAGPTRLIELLDQFAECIPSIYIFPNLVGLANMSVRPLPLGPYLGLSVSHARFSELNSALKRAFDIAMAIPVTLIAAPVIAMGAAAVKLNSPGPAFYSQTREGRNGRPIRIWKLRTMVVDADARLAVHLTANAEARFEWERTLKLRNDPRIIPRVGRFLRRASVDELPQLWNVLNGSMSLVGPRVMARGEVELYSLRGQRLRRDVPPGLTGLWQVSHRNNSDLRIREVADSYYVENWSIWMDLWILLRTVRVVVVAEGAY